MLNNLNAIQSACIGSQELIKVFKDGSFYSAGCDHAIYQFERLEELAKECKADAVSLGFSTASLLGLVELLDAALSECYQSTVEPGEWTALNKAIQTVGTMQLLIQGMRDTVSD